MFALNRWRVYVGWPYLVVTLGLWLSLHSAGVSAELAGVVLAVFLPTRPAPAAGPLLAQAATALAALEHAQTQAREASGGQPSIEQEPIWEWASRNLSAASGRLLSPAERVERAASPWSAYVVLPLFAFTATGISFSVDLRSPASLHVLSGVVIGLVVGKPLGVALAALAAVKTKIAIMPEDTTVRAFIGAAILCGVSDPIALLMADLAFPHGDFAAVAKIGVLIGSVIAAGLGALVLATSSAAVTPAAAEAAV
jgi:NhaA family Na+:H+ antiporter